MTRNQENMSVEQKMEWLAERGQLIVHAYEMDNCGYRRTWWDVRFAFRWFDPSGPVDTGLNYTDTLLYAALYNIISDFEESYEGKMKYGWWEK